MRRWAFALVALLCAGRAARPPDAHAGRSAFRPRGPIRVQPDATRSRSRSINRELVSATSADAILRVFEAQGDKFDDVNLSTAWNRIGKQYLSSSERRNFFQRHEHTLAHMRDVTDKITGRLPPRNLAGVAHGIARFGYRGAHQTMHRIASRSIECIHLFKPQEISNLAWAFSKAGVSSPELFEAIAADAARKLHDFKPQELANTAWAFSKAGIRAPAFFAAMAAHAIPHLELFKGQEIVNLVWAFATLREPCPTLFDHVAQQAAVRAYEFNSQELGNLAWSFAKAEQNSPALFSALADESIPRLVEFKPQELANTAWAFANAGVFHRPLFSAIAREAAPRMGEFKTQEISNTALAFAKAGFEEPELFRAIESVAAHHLEEFRTQEIANTIWAYATIGLDAPHLYTAVANAVHARPSEFNPQELTNVAWSFAKRGVPADDVFEEICEAAIALGGSIAAQGIANLAWAFASVGAPSAHKLLRAFEEHIIGGPAGISPLAEFKAQEIANLMWACATVGAPTTRLFAAVAAVAPVRIADFEPQDVANTAWAFTVMQQMRPAIAAALVARAVQSGAEAFGVEAACQLHQFNMALRLDAPFPPDVPGTLLPAGFRQGDPAPRELPAEMARLFHRAMVMQVPGISSQLHRYVSFALSHLGVAHVNELCVALAGYHCDIAILPDPAASSASTSSVGTAGWEVVEPARPPASPALASLRSIIIEVNGPWHYTLERVSKPASRTKVRHLRRLGWNVVEVPWWEWEALDTAMAKEDYLQRALEAFSAGAPASNSAGTAPLLVVPLAASTDLAPSAPAAPVPRGWEGQPASDRAEAEPAAELSKSPARRATARTRRASAGEEELPRARQPGGKASQAAVAATMSAAAVEWDASAVDALIERLVLEVRGVSRTKGDALLARALDLVQQGRDLGALTADDWMCPGIGEKLALKVHGVASGARPTGSPSAP